MDAFQLLGVISLVVFTSIINYRWGKSNGYSEGYRDARSNVDNRSWYSDDV